MNVCGTTRFAIGAPAVLILLLLAVAGPAAAKGPIPTPPPVSMYLTTHNGQDVTLTSAQADSLGRLIRSIPQSYNASWRPAILDLASRSTQNLTGQWIDHLRLNIEAPFYSGRVPHYNLTVFLGTISNGSESEIFHHAYPADATFGQLLAKLNSSFGIEFSASGPYLSYGGADEFFYFIDPYFHHFNAIDGLIAQNLTAGLVGKPFSWLTIALLDENAIRLDGGSQSRSFQTSYYGTGASATGILVATTTMSSTMTQTLTLTRTQTQTIVSPITSVTTTTVTTDAGPSGSGASYVGYLILAAVFGSVASVLAVAYLRKR